ncbi:MAG: YhdP family protein [Gammaproteobacteria bacterium]
MLKRTLHTIWLLSAVALLLAAIALSVARLLVPALAGYRQEIETAAGAALNKQVSIGGLAASLHAMSPVLRLRDVVISDAARDRRLEIGEVRLSIDVEHYLAEHELRVAGIDINGADLTLVRDVDGRLFLAELLLDESAGIAGLTDLQRLSIHDSNITIDDRLAGEPPRRFTDVTLTLMNDGFRHAITGHARLPGELGRRVDIEAAFTGPGDQPRQWRGNLYVRGQSVVLPAMLARLLPERLAIQGVADVRLWFRIAAARVHALSGELDARDFQLEDTQAEQSYRYGVDAVSGQFGWRAVDDGWQFAVQNLAIEREQQSWRTENLSLAGRTLEATDYVTGASARFNLNGLTTLLPVLPGLDTGQRRLLARMQPRGVFKDLHFAVEKTAGAITVTGFNARFAGLSIEQTDALPLVRGLDGELRGNFDAGTLTLDSRNAGYQDKRFFREVLPIRSARGDIRWWRSDGHIELAADKLTIRNADLSLAARFGLDFPPAGEPASINLKLDVLQAAVGRVAYYLPARVMPASGVAWLDRSLVSGTVADGSVIVNGRFDQLPFDNGEGELEVRLPVTDAVLDFNEGWTPVTGLDAQVDFSGRRMDIRTTRGSIRSAALEGVHARIADLATPDLTIQGKVHGELPVMLAELGSSPLGEIYGGFVDRVTTTGKAGLDLDLLVRLSSQDKEVEVSGRIRLDDNSLRVKESKVALEHIQGELAFDEQGIKGDRLKASLFGKPTRARVWTLPGRGGTKITLTGPLDLFARMMEEESVLRSHITGSSDWQVLLSLRGMPRRGERADVGLEVFSSLVGTTVDLPAPFGKSADTVRKFSVKVDRVDFPEKNVHFSYADLVNGRLQFRTFGDELRLQRGAVGLGEGTPGLPEGEELLVSGGLEAFRLAEWQPYLGTGPPPGLPVTVRVDIAELQLMGHVMRDVGVRIRHTGPVWDISSEGPSVAGDIRLTRSGAGVEKVDMSLQRLVLESRDEPGASGRTAIGPAEFPDLEFTAERLVYDGADFGRVQLQARKQAAEILDIGKLVVASDLVSLQGSGQWKGQGEQQMTSMKLEVSDGKTDRLMKLLGYQESIRGGELSGSMNAVWPGAPWSFVPSKVEGRFELLMKNGQLLDVEPGAAGRALGLLSLTALPRRLVLDFSDLFGEGFGFDTIKGSFTFDDGNAYTDDLAVDGPAARILITGRVGIADRDYDELITVTPYLNTGVTLVGSLAGGPAVGAALLVAESLLKQQVVPLNRMARKKYSVTGSWDDPVITRLDRAGRKAREPDAADAADAE